MKIIDTIPFFMRSYQASTDCLRNYHDKYPEVFKEYFAYHCKNTEERHLQSIAKYSLTAIDDVHAKIIPVIEEVAGRYSAVYQVSFPIEVNLIAGGFGSNAFTHRMISPNITFALEKLSPGTDHLKAIVAHKFGHACHNIISNNRDIVWSNIRWGNPLTWLYQEGAATHFSRMTEPGLNTSVYFSFDDGGDEWLEFAVSNQHDIKLEFAEDYVSKTADAIFLEWFSIRGGERFGYSRLGYFLGDMFFQSLVERMRERHAITAWKRPDFIDSAEVWLDGKGIVT
ncbi:hypothetical protein [Cytobacillus oceanisediminis]|uniref:hypothetical protein n=1 Tax=Cytobacillus oceanisediminis TaxID=665099 RepID=UPI002495853D|nr:hypothetical protein [Cytobacillus oceanisediminis]